MCRPTDHRKSTKPIRIPIDTINVHFNETNAKVTKSMVVRETTNEPVMRSRRRVFESFGMGTLL